MRRRIPLHASLLAACLGAAGGAIAAPPPSDVGDADSFGRPARFLGTAQAMIAIEEDCTGVQMPPGSACIAWGPTTFTPFRVDDLDRIVLPAGAAHSLICQMVSATLQVQYTNTSSFDATAHLTYEPRITIHSQALMDPSLVDPWTGQPFNGQLETGTGGPVARAVPLRSGEHQHLLDRDTTVCAEGLLSIAQLERAYRLPPAVARQVFDEPMTIALHLRGAIGGGLVRRGPILVTLRLLGD